MGVGTSSACCQTETDGACSIDCGSQASRSSNEAAEGLSIEPGSARPVRADKRIGPAFRSSVLQVWVFYAQWRPRYFWGKSFSALCDCVIFVIREQTTPFVALSCYSSGRLQQAAQQTADRQAVEWSAPPGAQVTHNLIHNDILQYNVVRDRWRCRKPARCSSGRSSTAPCCGVMWA